jgi:hypothetical protein
MTALKLGATDTPACDNSAKHNSCRLRLYRRSDLGTSKKCE